MCEINWEIVQKFIECLIWPSLVLALFLIFRTQITKLINRIAYDSEKIDLAGLLSVQFKQVEKIKAELEQGKQPTSEQINVIVSTTVAIQIESIELLGEEYLNSSFDQRRIIESRINEYSVGLTITDIQTLIESKEQGHKIAAAIALEPILYRTKIDPADDISVKNFIVESLKDSNSFLRYECLQLVFQSKKLKEELKGQLEKMKLNDKNNAIRNILNLFTK